MIYLPVNQAKIGCTRAYNRKEQKRTEKIYIDVVNIYGIFRR